MSLDMRRREDAIAAKATSACTPEDLAEVEERMGPHLRAGVRHLVLDVGRIDYAGSSFVGRLLALRKLVDEHDGRMILVRPAPFLSRVLGTLGLRESFATAESEDEALGALRD